MSKHYPEFDYQLLTLIRFHRVLFSSTSLISLDALWIFQALFEIFLLSSVQDLLLLWIVK